MGKHLRLSEKPRKLQKFSPLNILPYMVCDVIVYSLFTDTCQELTDMVDQKLEAAEF